MRSRTIRPPNDGLDIRHETEPTRLLGGNEPDDEIPWIDFFAAGISRDNGKLIGWIATAFSHERLLKLALSRRLENGERSWIRLYSARAQYVRFLLNVLNNDGKSQTPRLRDKLPVENVHTAFTTSPLMGDLQSDTAAEQSNSSCSIITWTIGEAATDNKPPNYSTKHFTSFEELLDAFFGPLRYYFATGWFPNVKAFMSGLSAFVGTNQSPGRFVDHTFEPSKSKALAGLGMSRLAEYGWLPPNWQLLHRSLDPDVDVDNYRFRRLKRLEDDGIRTFRIPCMKFMLESYLALDSEISLSARQQIFFQSRHATDRAILAIEYKNYIRNVFRKKRKAADDPSYGEKYYLFRFPQGILGLLAGFLHKTENIAIAYTGASSITNRSALLERLIRLYWLTPDDVELCRTIKFEVRNLLYDRPPSPKIKTSTGTLKLDGGYVDSCRELDKQIGEAEGSIRNPYEALITAREARASHPVTKVINQSEGAISPREDGCRTALDASSKMLFLDDKGIRLLRNPGNQSDPEKVANVAHDHLRRHILKEREIFEEAKMSSSSRERPLTLFLNIAKFIRRIVQRKVFVPTHIQDWVARRFRLVWIMPLDPTQDLGIRSVGKDISPEYLRLKIGSKMSTHAYPYLFSTNPESDSIEVDISKFFEFCEQLHLDDSDDTSSNWLKNKIVETIYMLSFLDQSKSYCSDFELAALLIEECPTEKAKRCIELLPTNTILKCILMQNGGGEMLKQWSEDLLNKCSKFHAASRSTMDRDECSDFTQVEVFLDHIGIAGGAIDCCKTNLRRSSCNELLTFKLYLRPGRLIKHFKSRMQTFSPGVKAHDDKRESSKKEARKNSDHEKNEDNDQKDSSGNHASSSGNHSSKSDIAEDVELGDIEAVLTGYFASPSFPLFDALGLLRDWYFHEGAIMGETVEDLLADLESDLRNVPSAYNGFRMHKDALVRAFYEAL